MKMSWQKLKNLIQTMDERREGSQRGKAFEELVTKLLELLLEIPFVPAKSGTQLSGDARSVTGEVSVQTKNYTQRKNIDDAEIARDIHRIKNRLRNLDVYVLAVSRDASAQLRDELDDIEKDTDVDIVVLELNDRLSDIGALCVTYWTDLQDFQEFFGNQ